MVRTLLKTSFIALLFLLICNATFAQWSNVNAGGIFGRIRASSFVIGDTVYLGSGDNGGPYTNDFRTYTQASNTWNEITRPFPGSGGDDGFFFTVGDTGYMGDGYNNGWHNDFWGYTPATGWISLGTPPGGDRAFCAGFSIGNKGYFGTGYNSGQQSLNDFYGYDPVTNTWTTLAPVPGTRIFAVGFSANGKGYIGLGVPTNPSNVALNDMYRYNPGTNTWDTMASLPAIGELQPASFVLCGKLIITLGDTTHSSADGTFQTWMFDPSDGTKGTWTRLQDFSGTAVSASQGFAIGDTGFVFGGTDSVNGNNNNYILQIWRYVPATVMVNPIDTIICPGAQVTLKVSGGTSYVWSNSDTGSSITVSPDSTTIYKVVAASAICFDGSDSIIVDVNPTLPLEVKPVSPSICNGQGIALKVPYSGSNYNWSPSTGLNNTTGDSVIASPTMTIVYTVTGNDSSGCISTGIDTVKVISALPLSILPANPILCNGQSATLYIGAGGSDFMWSPAYGIKDSTASGDSVVVNPTVTTTYTVAGIDSGGCASTGSDIVTVIPSPNMPTFTQNGNILTSSSIHDNQWYRNDTLLANDTSQNLITTSSGWYWVVVANEANGCSTASDSIYVKLAGIDQLSLFGAQVSIYPNPINNSLFIKISSSADNLNDYNLRIIDVLGRIIYSKQSLGNINDIDLTDFSGGVYFISIVNKSGNAIFSVVKDN